MSPLCASMCVFSVKNLRLSHVEILLPVIICAWLEVFHAAVPQDILQVLRMTDSNSQSHRAPEIVLMSSLSLKQIGHWQSQAMCETQFIYQLAILHCFYCQRDNKTGGQTFGQMPGIDLLLIFWQHIGWSVISWFYIDGAYIAFENHCHSLKHMLFSGKQKLPMCSNCTI